MVLWGLIRWILFGRADGVRAMLRRSLFGWLFDDGADADEHDAQDLRADPVPGVQAPSGFEVIMRSDALQPGEITEVFVAGEAVALANVDGEFFAVSNTCAHAGGPIGDGTLDGHTVTCPYHGWSYDVRTGACFVNQDASLDTFDVQIVDDAVCVGTPQ